MKGAFVSVVCCSLLGLECATNGQSPNAGATDNGRVAGVVKLPESISAERPCDKIDVVAMAGSEQVGRTTVRQSRARCSYEITNLPAGQELQLQVKSDGVQCSDGKALSAQAGTLTLQDNAIKAHDFTASCGS